MSTIGQPNLRRWAGSWDGSLRRPKSCFVKEGFELAEKTGYGRTVSNIQGKGIPNDGSSYRKTARPKPVQTRGTNNKLEPEERKVQDGT